MRTFSTLTESERLARIGHRQRCCGATNAHCDTWQDSWLPDVCDGCGHTRGCHYQVGA